MYGAQGNQNLAANQQNASLLYGANTAEGQAQANADMAKLNASANGLNAIGNIAGSAAKLIPGIGSVMSLSDRDAKREVEPVGKLNDGQTVHRFAYKDDPPGMTRLGLIAQEVEKRDKGAVKKVGGLRAVDMKRATDKAARMSKLGSLSKAA